MTYWLEDTCQHHNKQAGSTEHAHDPHKDDTIIKSYKLDKAGLST